MTGMVDIHCHLLPYVDDGAVDLVEAVDLLRTQWEKGVHSVILTPHFRHNFFETPQCVIDKQLLRLKKETKDIDGIPKMYLTREYYVCKYFMEMIECEDLLSIGKNKSILIEFPRYQNYNTIFEQITRIIELGYTPIIAHVERYICIVKDFELVKNLVDLGALIQVNASSVMGKNGFKKKHFCNKIIRNDWVNFIASDSHNMDKLSPNLDLCAEYLIKRMGLEYAERILKVNPMNLLQTIE